MPLGVALREKPDHITVHSDLSGLLVLKLGRKSSPNKVNPGKSVRDQFSDLDVNCARYELVEYDRIEEDKQGASQWAKQRERKKWEYALETISTKPIAVFAIWELSRSARRLMQHGRMMEALSANNVLLLVGDRLYDPTNPQDEQSLGFNAVMDATQVAFTRDASRRGLRTAAAEGRPHGPQLYGYARVYNQRTRALEGVEIVEEEAAVIRQIVEWVKAGKAQRWIARECTKRMLANKPGYQRPRGASQWHAMEVRDLVTNIAYTGKRSHTIWDGHNQRPTGRTAIWDGMQPAIISDEDFEACRLRLDEGSNGASWPKTAKYLLTGIAICNDCESPMWSTPQKDRRKDRATYGNVRHAYACRKVNCRVLRDMIRTDTVVIDVVTGWMNNPKVLARITAGSGKENKQLRADRLALAAARQELEQAYELLSSRGIAAQEKKWLPEIDRLEVAITSASAEREVSAWADVASGAIEGIIPDDIDQARDLLRSLVTIRIVRSGRGQLFDPEKILIRPLGMTGSLPR